MHKYLSKDFRNNNTYVTNKYQAKCRSVDGKENKRRILPALLRRIMNMQRKTHSVASVEVSKIGGRRQRYPTYGDAGYPYHHYHKHVLFPSKLIYPVWEHYSKASLHADECQYEDGYFTGHHGEKTCKLAAPAFHPCKRVFVVVMTVHDVMAGDGE